MKRATWLDLFDRTEGRRQPLTPTARATLSQVDDALFDIWNLGENVLLAWTHESRDVRILAVRHYVLAKTIQSEQLNGDGTDFINGILAGPKWLAPDEFQRACLAFGCEPKALRLDLALEDERINVEVISNLVRRYGVSLVRGRAVVLLDAVYFSLHSPLEQVAMLNSLGYSVNSAYRQLLSKDIDVKFARTTTGDGFYIWNRVNSVDANIALYKLMMMILADNAVAQRKGQARCVPRLRAAFHVGDYYEFHQVEALNPTTFSYIVGQVTIDLSRMIEKSLPGQILLGQFQAEVSDSESGSVLRYDTLDFVEKTAATLDQLRGLGIAGDNIESIRCYLTGQNLGGGRYPVNRYQIEDKHGMVRFVYNAKINIHRERAEPIYLGIQREDLAAFTAHQMEILDRG